MRILVVHNYYQQWGGSDQVAEEEIRLLRQNGHTVELYSRHNDEIKTFSPMRKGLLFFEPTWSVQSYREIKNFIHDFKPQVAHFHNVFPLISPAAYHACADIGTPVVQTLHDYRMLCPIGWLIRNNKVCEECMHGSLWRGIRYACYHESRVQTSSVALMLKTHRLLGTWQDKINVYIALTGFARQKMIEGDIPSEKLVVRPNFLATDPGFEDHEREYGLFVGRLSPEKGLQPLLEAWRNFPDVELRIVGDGPLRPWIESFIERHRLDKVQVVGFLPVESVIEQMRRARFLLMPSLWYEGLPRTIVEAYAVGTPVIASDLGSLSSLIRDGETGLLFQPGDAVEFASRIEYALNNPEEVITWGQIARATFEQVFTAKAAYESLMAIYERLL